MGEGDRPVQLRVQERPQQMPLQRQGELRHLPSL
jgi:hypothetical protein